MLILTPAPGLVCFRLREVLVDVASFLLLHPLSTAGCFITSLNTNVHISPYQDSEHLQAGSHHLDLWDLTGIHDPHGEANYEAGGSGAYS